MAMSKHSFSFFFAGFLLAAILYSIPFMLLISTVHADNHVSIRMSRDADPVSHLFSQPLAGSDGYPHESLKSLPETRRVAKSELAGLSQTRTAAGSQGFREQFGVFPDATHFRAPFTLVRVGAGASLLDEIKGEMAINAAYLCGVDPALYYSVVGRESSWIWPETRHEAVGYAQIKPATARLVSPTLDVHTAWGNLLAGACYLRHMYDLTGDWTKAVHHYNVGPAGQVTDKTKAYAKDIMDSMEAM